MTELEIKLELPIDSTFLSQIIYEGLIYLINKRGSSFNVDSVRLEGDLLEAYKDLDENRIKNIKIKLVGNDLRKGERKGEGYFLYSFLKLLKIKINKIKEMTYGELLKLTKEQGSLQVSRSPINLEATYERSIVLDESGTTLTAPQLLKVDRYAGISSAEMPFMSKRVGLKASLEVILIALLGVYSSYIATAEDHYFAFLSPSEILRILASGDPSLLRNLYSVKEQLRDLLGRTLGGPAEGELMKKSKHLPVPHRRRTLGGPAEGELMVLEVMLNSKIRAELKSRNLDKVSINIFRVSEEGGITYKVHETLPITVYANPYFYHVLSSRGVDARKLCDTLQDALNPKGKIIKTLSSFKSKNKFDEADSILRGVMALYKFVTLADPHYLFQFSRCLSEAQDILERKEDYGKREDYKRRVEFYRNVQRRIGGSLRRLRI
ncbi:MAG: hypothetical protein QXP84_04540 [Candidatus Korarchaeum sp.]